MNEPTSDSLFFYQGGRLTLVRHGNGHRFILSTAHCALAEQQNRDGAQAVLLGVDHAGSTTSTLHPDGHQIHRYSAYGYNCALPHPIRFWDLLASFFQPDVHGYFLGNGYRVFTPSLMRFLSPDSLSPFGIGGINSYCYCMGDPVNRTDATGHAPTFMRVPTKIHTVWKKVRASGWESQLSDPHILSKIQSHLSSQNTLSLALSSKKLKTAVTRESNRIANERISIDDLLVTEDWKINGALRSSVEAHATDIGMKRMSDLVTSENAFERRYGPSTDSVTGRRHAVRFQSGGQNAGLSRSSSTDSLDSLLNDNLDIRDGRR